MTLAVGMTSLRRVWLASLGAVLMVSIPAIPAEAQSVPITVKISGSTNVPTFKVTNNSRANIVRLVMTIGNTAKHFQGNNSYFSSIPGNVNIPKGNGRSDIVDLSLNGFGPGETITFRADVDQDAAPVDTVEDYRFVMFNNGGALNSIIFVEDADGIGDTLILTDQAAASTHTFSIPRPQFDLTVESVSEGSPALPITAVDVTFGTQSRLNIGTVTTISVSDGVQVEIRAPQAVYLDVNKVKLTDSEVNDAKKILDFAEERFTPIGISVNDVPQTGDPTLYRFEMAGDTSIKVKWQHDFALRVEVAA